MARKLHIPKAAQIRGIRKALANRKTPRQFIPGLKKRLAKLLAAAALIFVLCGCAARPTAAQTPVTIIPQAQTLASTTACTGSAQLFTVNNRNQSQHWASIQMTGLNTQAQLLIIGIDASGDNFPISPVGWASGGTVNPTVVTGNGYYPTVQVQVICTGGTFNLSYSSSSAPFAVNDGAYLKSQIDKSIWFNAAINTNIPAQTFIPPFGSSGGTIVFQFNSGAISGSAVQVQCQGQGTAGTNYESWQFVLASTTNAQIFRVPSASCSSLSLAYTSGGASAGNMGVDYFFDVPGLSTSLTSYTHIPNTTATVVKAGPGVVHTVVVGTPAAGTISLFDLASGSCTGTPSTNIVSVITATTTFPSAPEIYDVIFNNGICVKASATMDITVSSQ